MPTHGTCSYRELVLWTPAQLRRAITPDPPHPFVVPGGAPPNAAMYPPYRRRTRWPASTAAADDYHTGPVCNCSGFRPWPVTMVCPLSAEHHHQYGQWALGHGLRDRRRPLRCRFVAVCLCALLHRLQPPDGSAQVPQLRHRPLQGRLWTKKTPQNLDWTGIPENLLSTKLY